MSEREEQLLGFSRGTFVSKPKVGSSGSVANVAAAIEDAQRIVDAAEQRAIEITSAAERSYQEARELGYREGFREGKLEASEDAVRLLADSAAVGDVLANEAAQLAMAICKTVIGEHIAVEPDTVRRVAMKALRESVVGDAATIRVHPDDKAALQKHLDEIKRVVGGAAVTIDTDASLSRGGCIVRTDFGEVDASIEGLLEVTATRLGIRQP